MLTEEHDRTSHIHPPSARTGDLLIIDDDPAIVRLLVSLLRDEEGFPVRAAFSVAQAFTLAATFRPAAIFLDLSLPGENVRDSIRQLRACPGWEDTRIVVCSGQDHLEAFAREVAATAWLAKPFNLDDVVALAERFAIRSR